MMPSRGCHRSIELWPYSPAIWQMCVLYMVFLSASYVLFGRLSEDNITGVESLLDPVLLASLPAVTRNETTVIPPPDGIPHLPETPTVIDNDEVEPPPIATDAPKIPQEPLLVQKPPQDPVLHKNDTVVHHDDIPSFSEWANKKMAEVEKNKGENHTVGTTKIRLKNYASPDCGAKVVAANPEAVSAGAVLSASRDDYMLNPCNVKIWFVVELCESIQPQRVEIANFELFSSSPQDLSIWVSDRYPTRDWSQVATVQAKDERTVQSFPLPRLAHFAKYVKVELHSHYGSEHYCPVSLFKAFGTSELEVLDNDSTDNDPDDESLQTKPAVEEEDESVSKVMDPLNGSSDKERKKPGDDLFRTAKEAVLSIVQKAAQVLGNGGARNNSCMNVTTSSQCLTPGYQIVCNNCTAHFYYRLYEIMCCNSMKLKELLSNKFVNSVVTESPLCPTIGINLSSEPDTSSISPFQSTSSTHSIGMSYLRALLGDDTLAALCNYLAVSRRKTALNVSQDKAKVEEVPPGSEMAVKETVKEMPVSIPPVTPPTEVDVEPTSSMVEPVITISPTKTLPINPEVNETTTVQEIPTTVESSQDLEENTDSLNITLPTNNVISEETLQPALDPAPPGLTEPVVPPVETLQQPPPTQDEQAPVDPIALDSLFPEEPEDEAPPQDTTTKPTTVNAPVQKESVFVRLANRIKALEVNMSLSSQYLEELSRRYKKQVEELQRTLAGMVEERRLASEREHTQSAQIALLTQKTEALTAAVTQMLEERSQWSPKVYLYGQHGVIMLIEIVVLFLVLGLCRWLMTQAKISDQSVRPSPPQRRHSLDGPPAANTAQPKKRRPSEEALIPSSSTHQELLIDGAKRKTSKDGKQRRKRRRKDKLEDGLSIVSADREEWVAPPGPEFIRTADWSRRQRASIQTQTSSSQETLGSIAPPSSANSSIKKKTGALKKIVKKLF
uniref:Protein osteopotentia n=2 Tax=Lygus hesperus TaxID=30085 RepID=A0A146MGE9_LYGHE